MPAPVDADAGEPWYSSFLRLTAGVARDVLASVFWHLLQTIVKLARFARFARSGGFLHSDTLAELGNVRRAGRGCRYRRVVAELRACCLR